MMYVEFMKNFLLSVSSEVLGVRLISETSRHYVRRLHEKFSSHSAKTFDSYFLDIMYVDFMKNFLLADSSELMRVRLITACWAQKRLIPTL